MHANQRPAGAPSSSGSSSERHRPLLPATASNGHGVRERRAPRRARASRAEPGAQPEPARPRAGAIAAMDGRPGEAPPSWRSRLLGLLRQQPQQPELLQDLQRAFGLGSGQELQVRRSAGAVWSRAPNIRAAPSPGPLLGPGARRRRVCFGIRAWRGPRARPQPQPRQRHLHATKAARDRRPAGAAAAGAGALHRALRVRVQGAGDAARGRGGRGDQLPLAVPLAPGHAAQHPAQPDRPPAEVRRPPPAPCPVAARLPGAAALPDRRAPARRPLADHAP
jgi:hypothetical protein